jgi:hypothetical protein
MSGLVFVRDAQGRPLMPMSAAYARTLVHQGKAQVLLHPAVSTIQLTRAVTTPTLRPVIMGLALTATMADVFIVVEQARSAPVSLQLVVDLGVMAWGTDGSHRRTLHHPRSSRYRHARGPSSLWRYPSILMAVIAACRQLIPISHLVLLSSVRGNALSTARTAWMRHRLQQRAGNIIVAREDDQVARQVPRPLMQVLTTNMLTATAQLPNVVCVTQRRSTILDEPTRKSAHGERHQLHLVELPLDQLTYRGRLVTIRQAGSRITGIIQGLGQLDQLMLWVPKDVQDQGIQWEAVPIPNPDILHVWPPSPILMMPLAQERHHE